MNCIECGSTDVIPIIYGYPTDQSADRGREGEFALGGCVMPGNYPQRHCNQCGARTGRPHSFVINGKEVRLWDVIPRLLQAIRERREHLGISVDEVCERSGLNVDKRSVRRIDGT